MDKKYFKNALEWFGVITAIVYSIIVASNTGHEVIGFTLLFICAVAIGFWAFLCRQHGIFGFNFFTRALVQLVW